MLDDAIDLTNAEMAEYWWPRLTDMEYSAWSKAAQSADAGMLTNARSPKCRAGVCSLATGRARDGLDIMGWARGV